MRKRRNFSITGDFSRDARARARSAGLLGEPRDSSLFDEIVVACLEHFHDRGAVEASRGEETGVLRALGGRCGRCVEFFAPDVLGACELGLLKRGTGIQDQRFVDAIAFQFVDYPACAQTAAPAMHYAFSESLIR
jgi:hypothetical protein